MDKIIMSSLRYHCDLDYMSRLFYFFRGVGYKRKVRLIKEGQTNKQLLSSKDSKFDVVLPLFRSPKYSFLITDNKKFGCIPIVDICKLIPPPPPRHHSEKFLI